MDVDLAEAVDLVKIYGSEKSASFVNGVLGKYVRSRPTGDEPKADDEPGVDYVPMAGGEPEAGEGISVFARAFVKLQLLAMYFIAFVQP